MLQGLLHRLGRSGRATVVWTVLFTWLGAPLSLIPQVGWAAFVDVTPSQMPPISEAAYSVVVGDVTGEGAPDVVVVSAGQSRLFINDGHGHFTDATAARLPVLRMTAVAAALGDVNGDGALDLVLANAAGQNRLLLNDGTGHFTDVTATHLPAQTAVSMGVALGDVDGDGALDLVVANRGSQVWLWHNDGHGHFTDVTTGHLPPLTAHTMAVVLGDVDGDGALDLGLVNHDTPSQLCLNNGLGVFTDVTATHLPGEASASSAALLVDVDGDGALDLVMAAGEEGVRLWHNDGHGHFTEVTEDRLPLLDVFGIQVAAGDVDGDGAVDLVVATAGQTHVLLNDGTGRFRNLTPSWLPVDTRRTFGVALVDVDGDLDLDLVLATPGGPTRLLLNDLAVPRLRVAVTPAFIEVGTPVTFAIEAFDEDGLAAATLTLTDPSGGTQVLDLLPDLATGHATRSFTPMLAGTYTATVAARDPQGHLGTRQVGVRVQEPDTTAPQVAVALATPPPLLVGQPVVLRVTATDERGVVRTTLTVNGTPVPLPTAGTATYVPTTPGLYTVVATATDAAGQTGSAQTTFVAETDSAAPLVTVQVTPAVVALTQPITLSVTATDNVAVTSRALRILGPVIPNGLVLPLDATGHATFTPFQPGTYTAVATAQDPTGNTGTGTATFEAQGVPDTTPPVLQLSGVPTTIAVGRPVTLTVTATDNVGVTALTLLLNDTPQPVDAAGRVTYTPPVVGTYTVVAVAQDGTGNQGSTSATFQAIDAAQDTIPPVVVLTTPTPDATITAPTLVRGTVQDVTLVRYTLAYSPRGEERFTTLATGTTEVVEGILGTFDPTLLRNDLYDLRLTAEDTNGRTTATTVVVRVAGQMKVGHLSFTIQDLTLPVVGFPITIHRTYDSRDTTPGDFGVGWRLDLQTTRVRKGRPLGTGWTQEATHATFPLSYCLALDPTRTVTLTLPDGRQEAFDLVPTTTAGSRTFGNSGSLPAQCQFLAPVEFATAVYQARPGTFSTLEALADDQLWVVGSTGDSVLLLSLATLDVYDPTRFRLTTPEGLVLEVEEGRGVQRLTEPNGNTLTFGPEGILHSAGPSVVFTRDAQGRITQITDPNGHTLTYTYDTQGDLVAVTDQEGNTTHYQYDGTHRLAVIADPRGITIARNLYDNTGRLIAHVDAEGHRIDYTHDLATRQEIITDRLGNTTVHEYDAVGNVVRTTDALGGVTTHTFDAQGNVLTETNALHQTRTATYDAQNNLLTATDPLGHTTTFTYNSRRQLLTVTDPLGRVTTNTYDANGNLTSTTDPQGTVTRSTYNARGLQTSYTDPLGQVTTYAYSPAGHLTTVTDPLGHTTTSTYDSNGNRLSQTATRTTSAGVELLTTTYTYDGRNRLVQTTYANGSTAQVVYNAIGQQSATLDPLGRQTTYDYDDLGRLVQTTSPDGTSEESTYDAEDHHLTRIDRAGRVTTFQYDPLGRLIGTTYPDGATTLTGYDLSGQVVRTTDPFGHATQFAYDAAGRRTTVTDALGHSTTFTYDQVGHQTAVTNANGNTTTYAYDENDRRTTVRYPDGTIATTTYDPLGRPVSKTDQAGKTTRFAYDAFGRLITVTDALGQVTQYTYDELGHRLTQTDANNHTTHFAYDQLGRRITRTLPLGMAETYAYDAAGNLRQKTDFNGKTTTYDYDAVNRLTQKHPDPSLQEPSVQFTYTASGQRATMTDASGTTTYTYDARDRLLSKATPQGTLHYTYDLVGNPLSIASSQVNGVSITYTYDTLNRLATVTDHRLHPGTTTYSYDAVGNLVSAVAPNGVQSTSFYDPLNRLTALTIRQTSTVASYTYTLGPAGNRLSVTERGGRTATYTYDDLYRLTQETITGDLTPANNGTISYTYDPVGNRLTRNSTVATVPSVLYAYDRNDRLLNDTSDHNGNTIGSNGTTYAYDFENRLTQQNGGDVTIVYDGDGHRVAKAVGGVTTQYLVDDRNRTGYAQVLEELVNGTVQRVYTYGRTRISQRQAAGATFYGYDGHGSVRVLTDAAGALTATYDYSAFGELLSHTGAVPNDYLFAGEPFDAALELYYNRARYLNVETGRFLTRDTYEGRAHDPLSLHAYAYAHNNAVNRVDPSGHQVSLAGFAAGIGTFASLAAIQSGLVLSQMLKITPPGEEEQVPMPGVARNANYNAIELINAPSAAEIFDKYIKTFVGVDEGSVAKVTGAPVGGIGQKLKFALNGWKGWVQAPFSVRVKRYAEADHVFSVVTLQGHPLAGWRYWRVVQLDNHPGHLRVETGAIDTPAPGLRYAVLFAASKSDQLRIWEENLQYILSKSGAQAVDVDLVGGTWFFPDQSELEQQICAGASFCK